MGEATAGGVRTEHRDADQVTEVFRRPDLPAGATPQPPTAGAEPAAADAARHRPEPLPDPEPGGRPEPVRLTWMTAPAADPRAAAPVDPVFDIDLPLDVEPEPEPEPAPPVAARPPASPHDVGLSHDAAAISAEPAPRDVTDADDASAPSWNRPSGVSPITRAERRAAEAAATARATGVEQSGTVLGQAVWALTRVAFGVAFLWTFLDRLLGFGAPTPAAASWRAGAPPISGVLGAVDGPFGEAFGRLAGHAWVDWAFMVALAAVGLGLLLGVGMTVAATAGTALLVLSWLAALPIEGNPFLDGRLLGALVIICLAVSGAGLRFSLAPWWRRTAAVRKLPVLR
ncbi:hypothetical protein SAMN05444365_101792 [Micromonospora pattaloongensis]|uniref:Thiosulfate dehydrogenase [quinone] large subunit n=1 Tax=Micromonospora pattaloongensis TaxID=405436 RepID=A0A1H3HEI6_9ACTN|nr:hypothetical protein [Micromonospora pattaloongensis]SDY13635.1 hypothetical protein SAMN05444365_101792 [Micromonospora pattaloongensis]